VFCDCKIFLGLDAVSTQSGNNGDDVVLHVGSAFSSEHERARRKTQTIRTVMVARQKIFIVTCQCAQVNYKLTYIIILLCRRSMNCTSNWIILYMELFLIHKTSI